MTPRASATALGVRLPRQGGGRARSRRAHADGRGRPRRDDLLPPSRISRAVVLVRDAPFA